MAKVKPPYAAGRFFLSNKEELIKQLDNFKTNHQVNYSISSRIIIVPHAGYDYSGQLAYSAFSYLKKTVKNIFIIAPTHKKSVNNLALSNYSFWETPLGNIKVNKDIQEEILLRFKTVICEEAFEEEHSIEVQLPFIKFLYDEVQIIPILVGNDDVEKVLNIIKFYYKDKNNAFVISSDLSHFLSLENAFRMDILTARMIEDSNPIGFRFEQACGAVPICALIQFCKEQSYSMIRVGLTNSAKLTNNVDNVVGYGAWFLIEGSKNNFIKKYFSPKVLDIIKKTIDLKLKGREEINITNYLPYPPVLDSVGACFVSLKINNKLRGCIGSVIPQTPLLIDLIKNANNVAFSDPRFSPLTREEFDDIQISVSLLNRPKKIDFNSQEDLFAQIRQNIDGIIIKDGAKQALYLPSVWELLPNKKIFFDSLKEKAGITESNISPKLEIYSFTTEDIMQ